MRPTIKMYNDAVNAADNWRKNADTAAIEAAYWYDKFNQTWKRSPVFFLVGVLIGVLGCLIATTLL